MWVRRHETGDMKQEKVDLKHNTRYLRQETWDRRHETGYMRQKMWDRRCETGDIASDMIKETRNKRQEAWDRRHMMGDKQSSEFTHKIFEQITRFLPKRWANERFAQKVSNLLIRSLLVRNLRDSLTMAHSFWATWANHSRFLFCPERLEQFAHYAQKEWANLLLFLKLQKNCKNVQKIRFFRIFWANRSFFVSESEKELSIFSKKIAIRSFLLSDLSESQQFAHSCSFVMSESLTYAHLT